METKIVQANTAGVAEAAESVGSLAAHARPESEIRIWLKSFLGTVTIEMSSEGEEYSLTEAVDIADSLQDSVSDNAQEMLRNAMLTSIAGDLKYRHRHGVNQMRMTVVRSKRAFLYWTLGAMVLGVVAGLLLSSFAPAELNTFLNEDALTPIKTMYMNSLKMIVAPVVFFSIVSCIVRFSDLSELGRVGGRVIALFLLTTCAAVAMGIGSFLLFQPGQPWATAWETSP